MVGEEQEKHIEPSENPITILLNTSSLAVANDVFAIGISVEKYCRTQI